MPTPCINCRLNKKRVFFDIEKARIAAKKLAIQNEKTYAIYQEGKAISYTDADTARASNFNIIEFLSQY